jgi:hypothetical protein
MEPKVVRFEDFTNGHPIIDEFVSALREVVEQDRFNKLSVAEVVGVFEVLKMELLLRLHNL